MTDDLDVVTKLSKLIEKYESMRDNLIKPNLNGTPFFQLMDVPQTSKTDNMVLYEGAETLTFSARNNHQGK